MATTSNKEKIILTINERNRKVARQSEDIDLEEMINQLEHRRMRRNAAGDTSFIPRKASITSPQDSYQQIVERVRELEKEVGSDRNFFQLPPIYSPFSSLTPCSTGSGGGFSSYSPNSSVPTQRFGLSPKAIERAHQIPERFWIDWRQKQMQNRIEELESMKRNYPNSHDHDSPTTNRRKSLLLLHELQRRLSLSRSKHLNQIISTSIDTETSSPSTADDLSLFNFDQRSIDLNPLPSPEPITPKLDRSRLTISIPPSNLHLPKQSIERPITCAGSIEDVAQIDTEFQLTLFSQENSHQTSPLFYSKAILNQTIEFRSSSSKKD